DRNKKDGELIGNFWALNTASGPRPLVGHEQGISDLAVARNGKRLLTGSHDRTARIWDVPSLKQVVSLEHKTPVRLVAWAPSGVSFVTVEEATLHVWSDDGKPQRTVNWEAYTSPQLRNRNPGIIRAVSCPREGDQILVTWVPHETRKGE